jgi:hypothetical protein
LTAQPTSPNERHSHFSGWGYPEPYEILAMEKWKLFLEIFPRKEVFVFTETKFTRRASLGGNGDQEDWSIKERKLVFKVSVRWQEFCNLFLFSSQNHLLEWFFTKCNWDSERLMGFPEVAQLTQTIMSFGSKSNAPSA